MTRSESDIYEAENRNRVLEGSRTGWRSKGRLLSENWERSTDVLGEVSLEGG